jgi:ribosomal protein L11 methyltransferase
MVENPPRPDATHVARLAADQSTVRRLGDVLAESFEDQGIATAAYERPDGRWTLAIHFSGRPNETAVRAFIALAAGAKLANALVFDTLDAKDWVKASLGGLTPVEAGRFLVHGKHDRDHVATNRIGIEIEAALTFGTGHHGTTRGCLLALDHLLKRQTQRRTKILDIGTGTGVLAIAAARALRRPVLASDIDPVAVRAARDNARLNKTGAMVEVILAAGLRGRKFRERGPFDIVFANILLGPLQRLAQPMERLLAPGACVVLSGLLAAHAHAALAAYRAQGLVLERRIILEGWVTLVLKRPALLR